VFVDNISIAMHISNNTISTALILSSRRAKQLSSKRKEKEKSPSVTTSAQLNKF
jgi:hypothetical protein